MLSYASYAEEKIFPEIKAFCDIYIFRVLSPPIFRKIIFSFYFRNTRSFLVFAFANFIFEFAALRFSLYEFHEEYEVTKNV